MEEEDEDKEKKANKRKKNETNNTETKNNKLEMKKKNQKKKREDRRRRRQNAETAQAELDATGTLSNRTAYKQLLSQTTGIDRDWQDVIFDGGIINSHSFSARGGSKSTKFSVSLGYSVADAPPPARRAVSEIKGVLVVDLFFCAPLVYY